MAAGGWLEPMEIIDTHHRQRAMRFTGDVGSTYESSPRQPEPKITPFVHFTPGARTAWHKHCNGQTLRATEGIGLTQVRGGDATIIRPGDTIWVLPEWHLRHGAAPTTSLTHLAAWGQPARGAGWP